VIQSNRLFTVRGYWPGQRTTNTDYTYCLGATSTSYRTIAEGQTVEWRVDLVHLDDNATNAVKFVVGTPEGVYGFFKWRDFVLLDKAEQYPYNAFSFEKASIPNSNVVLAVALTRARSNVILTGRALDKENPAVVLYERSVVDTPGADPALTTAEIEALSGMRLAFGPESSGAPYTYAGAAIGLFQYTDGSSPAATVTYDNLELWTYRVPIAHYVDAASPGDEIVVTNGLYATGGRAVGTNVLVNRVAVDKPLSLRSVNGPQATVIQGYQVPSGWNGCGDGAIRCVYLTNGASLSGFTLTNGATRVAYDWPARESGGGGVWCKSTDTFVTNCVLTGNSAYDYGGGAYGGTLSNCMLSGNSANDGGGACGGTLNNCVLTGNSAMYGGGAGQAELNNCTLTGNSAGYGGGGGAYWSTLNNCIVYYNSAQYGGANYDDGTFNYCCTTPLPAGPGNLDEEPQLASAWRLGAGSPCRGRGSAAYARGLDLDGEGWANPPSIGCDEYWSGSVTGALSVAAVAAYTNVAVGFGVEFQAIIAGRVSASRWDFGDGTVVSNRPWASHVWTTAGDYVVELRAYNESYPAGVAATVTVHVVQNEHYVAPNSSNPVPPYMTWATAATNIQDAVDAAMPGALVWVSNGVYQAGARVLDGMSNRVAVTRPVTLRSVNGPEFTVVQGCQVPGTTNGDGAIRCVYLASGAALAGFTLTNGATQNSGNHYTNQSGGGGGAARSTLNNCTLTGNSADYGGGVNFGRLNNCTLVGNSATSRGGGAQDSGPSNCILYFNTAAEGANYDFIADTFGGWPNINSSCTTPMPTNGVGNITNAPLFVDYAGGNLRLQSTSPCINAGNNAYAPGPADLDGNPRIVSGAVDIGAYEFQGPGSVISYAWLQQYGLPTDGSADYADPDHDGLNTWQEWRCQTDPTNALSALRLLSATSAGTTVTVTWQSVAGVSYFLEWSTNLASPFIPLATGIPGLSGTTTCTDTNAASVASLFYRVGVGN